MNKELLIEQAKAKQADRASEFQRLALQVAGNDFPMPEEIVEACTLAGRTLDEFAVEVDRIEKVNRLRASAERGAAAQDRIAEIQHKAQAIEAELARIIADYRQRLHVLGAQADEARAVLAAAKSAGRELRAMDRLPVVPSAVEAYKASELELVEV